MRSQLKTHPKTTTNVEDSGGAMPMPGRCGGTAGDPPRCSANPIQTKNRITAAALPCIPDLGPARVRLERLLEKPAIFLRPARLLRPF